jgi:hypothetical protein
MSTNTRDRIIYGVFIVVGVWVASAIFADATNAAWNPGGLYALLLWIAITLERILGNLQTAAPK